VWLDKNKNGIQDPGEPGIEGVKVSVAHCEDGAPVDDYYTPPPHDPVAPKFTDENGDYGFIMPFDEDAAGRNLNVKVTIEIPSGYSVTKQGTDESAEDSQGADREVTVRADEEFDSDFDAAGTSWCYEIRCTAEDDHPEAGPPCHYENVDAGLVLPDAEPQGPGVLCADYWRLHKKAWPVACIEIGGVKYSRRHALALLNIASWLEQQREKKNAHATKWHDRRFQVFSALVAAELNRLNGNVSECIEDELLAAHKWLKNYAGGKGLPCGSAVYEKATAWKHIAPVVEALVAYSAGELCAVPAEKPCGCELEPDGKDSKNHAKKHKPKKCKHRGDDKDDEDDDEDDEKHDD
jgi:hypothetical protein